MDIEYNIRVYLNNVEELFKYCKIPYNKYDDIDYETIFKNIFENDIPNNNDNNNNELAVGNSISITYLPYSQKYIKYYDKLKFSGKIFYVKDDDILLYNDKILENKIIRTIRSVTVPNCSDYGNGYEYYIDFF